MVWTVVSDCYACRFSRQIGVEEFPLNEVRLVLLCSRDNTIASRRCKAYEYEPGTDADEVRPSKV